jgi:hypothetical protein
MPETTTVRPGQIWADNDKRSNGRELRIERVDDQYAYAVSPGRGGRFQQTRIRLDRFRPTSTGYRLVQDVEATS